MSLNNSLSPNRPNNEISIFNLILLIPNAVHQACLRYGHYSSRDEIDELSQDIVLLLINDDCRRMKSFDHRASLETWLQSVANRFVLRHLQRRKEFVGLEEVPSDYFVYQPNQVEKILFEERLKLLIGIADKLTTRERKLIELWSQDVPADDIAKELRVKRQSVHRYKNSLCNKLKKNYGS